MSAATIDSETELEEIVRAARTVAVIGMRDESAKDQPAYEIPRLLQSLGLAIRPVNPKLTEVLGERAYASLADVPEAVDIVDVFRRSDAIPGIADEILALPADRRPRVFWMQTGITNDEAAARLSAAGIKVVQDRCLGVYSRRYRK
ncbi:MAG TPA: CoA-binding protein [Polyangia bacterium]